VLRAAARLLPFRRAAPRAAPGGVGLVLRALAFAAERHRDQRRRDRHASPFVNHPIEVATQLAVVGGISDPVTLAAAVLHDVIEDTATTAADLEVAFGTAVALLVVEVSDEDPRLPREQRRRLQALRAPGCSQAARLIKIADKTVNLRQLRVDWTADRRAAYLASARRVVDACRGTNAALERAFDEAAGWTAGAYGQPGEVPEVDRASRTR
jgi:guanosine-3',5'-bis(diphosphate) 3'-pyrophosphohydrolase